MSDPDDNGRKPPAEDQRTVFVPSRRSGGRARSGTEPPASAESPLPDDDSGTADAQGTGPTQWEPLDEQPAEPAPEQPPAAQPPPAQPQPELTTIQAGKPQTTIKIGDCLNHIYEVKRFIARGGMGEVFEGVNITSDERVAIKVMLPSLAADPNVIAMFHREARSMTRLQHEALVQYRVLAQEPQLGILYIVTEYIDGTPLCDVLGTLKPSPEQLEMLLRRLAAGLRAAHQLGVLHRDISPDNVLLESGRIERAKIVDFGIAKDLTPGSGTIIGEGFAGKLGYVAPEQLGDFNRELGPWTDVYSLALVMTAAAVGHDLQMGGTLVDAVDRRRKGPDLSGAPDSLRPVLAAMLQPNPVERLRSMDDVIAMLDAQRAPREATSGSGAQRSGNVRRGAIVGGGIAAILLVGGLTFWMTSGPDKGGPGPSTQTQAQPGGAPGSEQPSVAAAADPIQAARAAINTMIPSITCSWLNIVKVAGDTRELNVVMSGVAGDPSAAQSEVIATLRRAGFPNANADFSAIAPIEPGGCSALDAYRQIPRTEPPRLTTPQLVWEMSVLKDGDYKGQLGAQPIITLDVADPKLDLTLIGIAPAGVIDKLLDSRAFLDSAVARGGNDIVKLPNGAYRIKMDINHQGWSGLALITGKGPFPADVVRPGLGARNIAWQNRFATIAQRQGWKVDMLWFRVENQRGGD